MFRIKFRDMDIIKFIFIVHKSSELQIHQTITMEQVE